MIGDFKMLLSYVKSLARGARAQHSQQGLRFITRFPSCSWFHDKDAFLVDLIKRNLSFNICYYD